jgi:hypothetical protein
VEPSLNTSSISKSISNPSVRSLCLTQGSTRSSSASASASASVLSNSILVVSSADRYGIPDEDEIYGPERDAAIKSPSKGKKHVDNTVSGCIFLSPNNFAESEYISLLFWSSNLSNMMQNQERATNIGTGIFPMVVKMRTGGASSSSPPFYCTLRGSKILGPWMKPNLCLPYNEFGITYVVALCRTL